MSSGPSGVGGSPSAPRVRWIILSDLHLGEEDSLLTPVDDQGRAAPTAAAPVLDGLAAAVASLVEGQEERPGLILNGDALGLAFASMPEALGLFGRFARGVLDPETGSCGEVVYLPGNHDHHVWELAREAAYARQVGEQSSGAGEGGAGGGSEGAGSAELPPVRYSTAPRIEAGLSCPQLDAVLPEAVRGSVRVVYPNLLLREGARSVIVHHGHFAENIYRFASHVRRVLYPDRAPVDTVEQLEGENFAWIDFIWSLLGRSGEASEDFERLFTTLSTPDHLERRADVLAERIAAAVDFPYLPSDIAERVLARTLLERLAAASRSERQNHDEVCSPKTMAGLRDYLAGPARRQMVESGGEEGGGLGGADLDGSELDGATVIWGHTHKPFEKLAPVAGTGAAVPVYNSGGWTIDSHEPSPLKGAAVVLLSAELEVATLRVFDDGDEGGDEGGKIRMEVTSAEGMDGPWVAWLQQRVRPGGELAAPWANLGDTLCDEIRRRRALHAARFDEAEP